MHSSHLISKKGIQPAPTHLRPLIQQCSVTALFLPSDVNTAMPTWAALVRLSVFIGVICRFFGGRPEERAAVCHSWRTGGPLTAPVYASGDTTGQDSWCGLGEVWGRDGADMGAHAGGVGGDYRWAAGDGEGGREGRTGWTVRRITEHKRHVSKTEWAVTTCDPIDDNDIVLALDLRGLGSG